MGQIDQYIEHEMDAQVAKELHDLLMARPVGKEAAEIIANRTAYLAASLVTDPKMRESLLHHCDKSKN